MATLSVYFFATMVLLSWLPTFFGCCLKSGLRLLPWYGWYFEQHGGIFVSKKWTKDREHIIQTLKAASKLNVPVRRDLPNEAEETSVVINVCVCVCVCVCVLTPSLPPLSLYLSVLYLCFFTLARRTKPNSCFVHPPLDLVGYFPRRNAVYAR